MRTLVVKVEPALDGFWVAVIEFHGTCNGDDHTGCTVDHKIFSPLKPSEESAIKEADYGAQFVFEKNKHLPLKLDYTYRKN